MVAVPSEQPSLHLAEEHTGDREGWLPSFLAISCPVSPDSDHVVREVSLSQS